MEMQDDEKGITYSIGQCIHADGVQDVGLIVKQDADNDKLEKVYTITVRDLSNVLELHNFIPSRYGSRVKPSTSR